MAASAPPVDLAIDRRWLEEAARHDPVLHAFALWDLDHLPDRVEFRVARRGGVPAAYLLALRSTAGHPVVHWVGDPGATELLDALPSRPLVTVVPPELTSSIEQLRGPARARALSIEVRDTSVALPPTPPGLRRLGPDDAPALQEFGSSTAQAVLPGYQARDVGPLLAPGQAIWGAFEGRTLVGVARSQVRLPSVWIVNGVLVRPEFQGRGIGRAVTAEVVRAAEATGAIAALYVFSDNLPAVRAYAALGFRVRHRRTWIDAGANAPT